MNKTTEEIKLSVLAMAREDLLHKFQQILEAFRMTADDNNRASLFEVQFDFIRDGYPTTEEINKRAEEMYSFVTGEAKISQ
jgi:hypothetical protein